MGRFLLVANWKANKTVSEAQSWVLELGTRLSQVGDLSKIEIAIAPSFPLLAPLYDQIRQNNYPLTLTSQDISAFDVGAYTGEVPARILSQFAVRYALVGHSERRKYQKESLPAIESKITQAVENDIAPIICAQSLEEIPANIRNFAFDKFLLMYEPFSAISTDGQYHPESPEKVAAVLSNWQGRFGQNCRLLYGGSVSPDDVSDLLADNFELISGLVIGHASLAVEPFFAIIKKCLQTLS